MYFDKPEDNSVINTDLDLRITLSANSLGILVLGILPGPLMALCVSAIGV
jgi:NADH-quinone oxidoreductase subunit N